MPPLIALGCVGVLTAAVGFKRKDQPKVKLTPFNTKSVLTPGGHVIFLGSIVVLVAGIAWWLLGDSDERECRNVFKENPQYTMAARLHGEKEWIASCARGLKEMRKMGIN